MSSNTETERSAGWSPPLPILLVLAAAAAIGLSSMIGPVNSRAASVFGTAITLAVPAVIGGLIPQRHGRGVRLTLGLLALLFMLFVTSMWPDAATREAVADATVVEPKHLLSWLIGLPLAGAIAILFLPRQTHTLLRVTTLVVMGVTFFASLLVLKTPMARAFHFNEDIVWVARFGIHYHVALDGVSLWLVILATFITPIAAYASFGSITTRIKDWCFALLLLEAAMVGAFVSMDLFLFYVFWELMLIPMYVMIGVWGGSNRIKASIKFFLYTMAGSLMMLAAILYMAYSYGKLTGGAPSFDYFELQRVVFPQNVQFWLWAAFSLSFFIKVPMFPVHTWLPDAHTEAPTAGSVILAAVMLKMGTYGYLRFSMGLFPEASAEWATTCAGVAVIGGILYGALCAWRQEDVKKLVAYSSVAHLGYVMLGIFAATQASVEGAVLQMVNHGISTGALFLLVGVIYDRRHTRQLEEFGGLAKVMPVFATLFVIATMASIGVPGTNGFVGEFLIITGTFVSAKLGHVSGVQAVGAALGVIFAAVYMLSAVQRMLFGPLTKEENKGLTDINARELVAVAPLVVMIFVLGLFPAIFLNPMRDGVARTLSDYQSRIDLFPAPAYHQGAPRLLKRRPDAPPVMAGAEKANPEGEGAAGTQGDPAAAGEPGKAK